MKKIIISALVVLALALCLVAPAALAGVSALDSTRLTYDATVGGWRYTPTKAAMKSRQVALVVNYTKGDESRLDLAFAYQLTDDDTVYRLTERAYDNAAGDVVITLTASAKRAIPIPLPESIKYLFVIPTLDAGGGTAGTAILDIRLW